MKGVTTIQFVLGLIIVAVVVGASVVMIYRPAPPEEEKILMGNSQMAILNPWEIFTNKCGEWYAQDHEIAIMTTSANYSADTQIRQIRYLVESGAKALICSPVDMYALNPTLEWVHDQGIPIFTWSMDADTPDIDLAVIYKHEEAAATMAGEIVDFLTEKYGEPEGLVFEVQGDPKDAVGYLRNKGFAEVMETYPNIQVVVLEGDWDSAKAQRLTYEAIQMYGKPDAIYGHNDCECACPAIRALEEAGMLVPRGEPGHVGVFSLDASKEILDAIRDGWADRGLGQPVQFYVPLCIYYAQKVLEEGLGALPDVGTVVTAEDVQIVGEEHAGVNFWANQTWAPVTVDTQFGHRWLKIPGVLVTPQNVDDDIFWGNLVEGTPFG